VFNLTSVTISNLDSTQPKEAHVTYADSSALEADYGFRPTIGIREGLRKFAQWYAEYYK
jgi:nucleoside-diphosphate-sugar epimerase